MQSPNTPLNILKLKNNSEVGILEENLDIISNNLQQCGAELVSIISVMGAYRTGKSFLLDLILRFLKSSLDQQEKNESSEDGYTFVGGADPSGGTSSVTAIKPEEQFQDTPKMPQWHFEDAANKNRALPDWFLQGDSDCISEGTSSDARQEGFAWRPGSERCTQGIWLWSTPFVFTNNEGQRIAVLLMDTQGAWDSTMTQAQSATIFGMTALLSSKLVYNIQNKLEEDKLGNLDYITTFAQTVCKDLPGTDAPFGHLEFLIRDWPNYGEGFTLEECKQQMAEHVDKHINPENVPADAVEKVNRLRQVFRTMNCSGLPHPSLKVTKPNYMGQISAIDCDFIFLLDDFVRGFLGKDNLRPSAPLGREIRVDNFKELVVNFADVFLENQGMAIGLREAFVKVGMIEAREEYFTKFKTRLDKVAPESAVVDPKRLRQDLERLDAEAIEDFSAKLKPWRMKPSEEMQYINEFTQNVREVGNIRLMRNDQEVEGATTKLVASPVVCCGAWFLLVHHFFLYIVLCCGGAMHAKKWSARHEVQMFDKKVFEGIQEDAQKFFMQRWKDIQSIQIALKRFDPNEAMQVLQKAQQTGMAAVAAGVAAVPAATSTTTPTKFGKPTQ